MQKQNPNDLVQLIVGKIYDKGYEYVVPNQKGLRVTVGRPHNVSFLVGDKPLDVVSVMKRKSVSLDEFLPVQEQEIQWKKYNVCAAPMIYTVRQKEKPKK